MKITIEGVLYNISKKDYKELDKLDTEYRFNDDNNKVNNFLRYIENKYQNKGYVFNLYYK